MRYRLFGRGSGLRVSEVGLGTGLFGADGHPRGSRSHAKKVFDAYAEAGGR
jgi:aryl-alcohol dehydrogenase-like predicted oxidoreductase